MLKGVGEETVISRTDIWDESDLGLEDGCKRLGEGDVRFSWVGEKIPLRLVEESKGYDRQVKMGE